MDELFIDEGNQYEMYSQDVGYISCEFTWLVAWLALANVSIGRRHRCVLPIPSIRLFRSPCQVLRAFARDGLPGMPILESVNIMPVRADKAFSTGNDNVLTMSTDADMDRPRYRITLIGVIRAQDSMAGRREPFRKSKTERGWFWYARPLRSSGSHAIA